MSSLRQRLIETHLQLADRAASLMFRRVGEHIEWDELRALGYAGLVEAASRYDATAGASFSTFAWYRVQGAILDGLRKNSQVPAAAWRRAAALGAAAEVLQAKATEAAHADAQTTRGSTASQTMHQLADALGLAATACAISLNHAADADALLADREQPDAGADLDRKRATHQLANCLAALPPRERELLEKTYWHDMSIAEAGETLGLSRSWASRLHMQALARLRHVMAELAG